MMRHLIKKHRSQCMLYAFAMALNCDPDNIIKILGHDGTEILWPKFPSPKCFRGFHINEMVYVCFQCGFSIYEYPKYLELGHDESSARRIKVPYNIDELVQYNNGVLLNDVHAYAWDFHTQTVLDPDGPKSQLNQINWYIFYLIEPRYGRV